MKGNRLLIGFLIFSTSIILIATLSYTLYGGLRASILTDNIQMIVIGVLLVISVSYIITFAGSEFSFSYVKEKNPQLLLSLIHI